jgi:hypothetical protein
MIETDDFLKKLLRVFEQQKFFWKAIRTGLLLLGLIMPCYMCRSSPG